MCWKENGLSAPNSLTIIDVIVNMIFMIIYQLKDSLVYHWMENIHTTQENYEESGYSMIWIWWLSRMNWVFHILQEVGAKKKVSIQDPLTLYPPWQYCDFVRNIPISYSAKMLFVLH